MISRSEIMQQENRKNSVGLKSSESYKSSSGGMPLHSLQSYMETIQNFHVQQKPVILQKILPYKQKSIDIGKPSKIPKAQHKLKNMLAAMESKITSDFADYTKMKRKQSPQKFILCKMNAEAEKPKQKNVLFRTHKYYTSDFPTEAENIRYDTAELKKKSTDGSLSLKLKNEKNNKLEYFLGHKRGVKTPQKTLKKIYSFSSHEGKPHSRRSQNTKTSKISSLQDPLSIENMCLLEKLLTIKPSIQLERSQLNQSYEKHQRVRHIRGNNWHDQFHIYGNPLSKQTTRSKTGI